MDRDLRLVKDPLFTRFVIRWPCCTTRSSFLPFSDYSTAFFNFGGNEGARATRYPLDNGRETVGGSPRRDGENLDLSYYEGRTRIIAFRDKPFRPVLAE